MEPSSVLEEQQTIRIHSFHEKYPFGSNDDQEMILRALIKEEIRRTRGGEFTVGDQKGEMNEFNDRLVEMEKRLKSTFVEVVKRFIVDGGEMLEVQKQANGQTQERLMKKVEKPQPQLQNLASMRVKLENTKNKFLQNLTYFQQIVSSFTEHSDLIIKIDSFIVDQQDVDGSQMEMARESISGDGSGYNVLMYYEYEPWGLVDYVKGLLMVEINDKVERMKIVREKLSGLFKEINGSLQRLIQVLIKARIVAVLSIENIAVSLWEKLQNMKDHQNKKGKKKDGHFHNDGQRNRLRYFIEPDFEVLSEEKDIKAKVEMENLLRQHYRTQVKKIQIQLQELVEEFQGNIEGVKESLGTKKGPNFKIQGTKLVFGDGGVKSSGDEGKQLNSQDGGKSAQGVRFDIRNILDKRKVDKNSQNRSNSEQQKRVENVRQNQDLKQKQQQVKNYFENNDNFSKDASFYPEEFTKEDSFADFNIEEALEKQLQDLKRQAPRKGNSQLSHNTAKRQEESSKNVESLKKQDTQSGVMAKQLSKPPQNQKMYKNSLHGSEAVVASTSTVAAKNSFSVNESSNIPSQTLRDTKDDSKEASVRTKKEEINRIISKIQKNANTKNKSVKDEQQFQQRQNQQLKQQNKDHLKTLSNSIIPNQGENDNKNPLKPQYSSPNKSESKTKNIGGNTIRASNLNEFQNIRIHEDKDSVTNAVNDRLSAVKDSEMNSSKDNKDLREQQKDRQDYMKKVLRAREKAQEIIRGVKNKKVNQQQNQS